MLLNVLPIFKPKGAGIIEGWLDLERFISHSKEKKALKTNSKPYP